MIPNLRAFAFWSMIVLAWCLVMLGAFALDVWTKILIIRYAIGK